MRLINLLETLFGALVTLVFIGMIFDGKTAKCLINFILGDTFAHTKDFIQILYLGRRHFSIPHE
jgi:hypothetical protein